MIEQRISRIKELIRAVCSRINRDPDEVKVVAVSKSRTVGQIKEAVAAGITDIGENRLQEAVIKYKQLYALRSTPYAIKWHMVGHLQTNKVKEAVRIFDLIHSVDSLRLAEEIDRQAQKINKVQDILLEIKTSPEVTKFGIDPKDTSAIFQAVAQLKNIKVLGLMTIAPLVDEPEKARPYFRKLRELLDALNGRRTTPACPAGRDDGLQILSMGMTDDFEVAIEEGSNMLRLGRAIFENTD